MTSRLRSPDFFEKKLEGPYLNHAYLIKHTYEDYPLIRRFMSNGPKHGGTRKEPKAAAGEAGAKEDYFLEPKRCI